MENRSADCVPEESSWTFYIQGFMCDQNDDVDDGNITTTACLSSELESPSLVSDAASSAVKNKLSAAAVNNDCCKVGFCSGRSTDHLIPKSEYNQNTPMINKKQKNKVIPPVINYDLEDTASSPVNSPKVSYMNDGFRGPKQKTKKDDLDHHQVKRNIFGKGGVFGAESPRDC